MVFTPRTPSISQSLPLCTGAPCRASTRAPTREPGREPTREPGREPGREPTREPGRASTRASTRAPGRASTRAPTRASTRAPGRAPTRAPGRAPTGAVPLKPIRLPRGASARVTLKSLKTELVVGCGSMYTDLYTRTAPKSQHPSPKRKEIADSVRGKYPNPKPEARTKLEVLSPKPSEVSDFTSGLRSSVWVGGYLRSAQAQAPSSSDGLCVLRARFRVCAGLRLSAVESESGIGGFDSGLRNLRLTTHPMLLHSLRGERQWSV